MTTLVETGILDNVPAPPSLLLPQISFSAPQSRVQSPPSLKPKRRSFSQPVSPITKKPGSPIKKPLPPLRSPDRAVRKYGPRVKIATYNPRDVKREAPCPRHAYATMEQELAHMPSHSVGGVRFSEVERDVLMPTRTNCPVHVYAEAKSSIRSAPATFSKFNGKSYGPGERVESDPCPVHAYAEPPTSMRTRPATFAKAVTPREPIATSGPGVHAYSEMGSSLAKGGARFSTAKQGRDTFQGTARALAPVSGYAAPNSTLRSVGGTTFGSTPRFMSGGLSRTGLVIAASEASHRRPLNALKPLPKLMPLAEKENVETAWAPRAEGGSPREVEAAL